MIHKLSTILKLSYKSEKQYIKYLKSLDFEEFKEIYFHYMKIIIRYESIYKKQNAKKFSKNWFINRKIHNKYKNFNGLFVLSNINHIVKISNDLDISNNRKEELIKNIIDTRKTIDFLSKHPIILNENPTKEEIIKFNVLVIDSIYFNKKMKDLLNELNNS